jgi:hypothetical protein
MVKRRPQMGTPRARAGAVVRAAGLVVACALTLGVPSTAAAQQHHDPATVHALRVDTFTNPIGLGNKTPNLSWRLSDGRQTAYQVQVASSTSQLRDPDLWDSGKVRSDDTGNIAYAGAPLQQRQAVVWRVRVWDGGGAVSRWSAPASWEMGLLSNGAWTAKWIEDPDYTYATDDVPNPLPVFAKTFDLPRHVVKARLYMTGLGQYAAKMNGEPVGKAVLEPGQTSYFRGGPPPHIRRDVAAATGPEPPRHRDRQRRVPARADAGSLLLHQRHRLGARVRDAEDDRAARAHVRGRDATDDRDGRELAYEAWRHDILGLVGRRGLRCPPRAHRLDCGAQAQRLRMARRERRRPHAEHDADGHDAVDRRPAAAGDGYARGAPGGDQPGDAPAGQHDARRPGERG